MLRSIFHDFINFECKKFLFDGLLYKIKRMREYKKKIEETTAQVAFKAFRQKNYYKKGNVLKIREGIFTQPLNKTEKYETVFKQCRLCTYNVILRNFFCNHWFSGKESSIKYSELVFVDSGIQHARLTCHIVIFGLPRSAIFFHTIAQTVRFLYKKVIEQVMGVWYSPQLCFEHFLF